MSLKWVTIISLTVITSFSVAAESSCLDYVNDKAFMLKHSALNPAVALRTGDRLLKDRDYLMHPATHRLLERYPFLQRDRQYVYAQVKRDPNRLRFAKPLNNDIDIVLAAVQQDGLSLEHAGAAAKNNKQITWAAVKNNPRSFEYVGIEARRSKQLTLAALKNSTRINRFIAPQLKDDIDVANLMVKHGLPIRKISKNLHHNRDLMFRAIPGSGYKVLEIAPSYLKNDEKFVLAVLKDSGASLEYAQPRFQDSETMVWAAMQSRASAIEYASERLRKDKNFNLYSINTYGVTHSMIHDSLKDDPDIIQALLEKRNGLSVSGAGKAFTNNRALAMDIIAAGKIGEYRYFSDALRDDKALIMATLRKSIAINYDFYGSFDPPLLFASDRLKQDREVALLSAKAYWDVLDKMHPKFGRDKEIVLTVLKGYGWYVTHMAEHAKHIDKRLFEDEEIARALLEADGGLLGMLPEKFRQDKQMVRKALKNQEGYVLREGFVKSVPSHFLADKSFMLEVLRAGHSYLYEHLDESLKADRDILAAAGPEVYWLLPAKLKADKALVLQFLVGVKKWPYYGFEYKDIAPELQSDPDIIRAAVRRFPEALDYQKTCHPK